MWQKKVHFVYRIDVFANLKWIRKGNRINSSWSPTCATITDFNGDLNSDLAIGTDGAILVYSGNGDGSFSGPAIVPFSGLPNVIKAADVTVMEEWTWW
ncbi:MAG: hypothetical protein KIIPBIDF_01271 [Candidatus Methanoperedenaceae archaeon GB50]|nr:MAG: hypothetical protein KIIPBIDF_01271 [Candidatus Methanoperedenaceae archaeon GB50]